MCRHYQRNCKILAPCCQEYFDCRLCHDEIQNHRIDRYSIQKVQCNICLNTLEKSAQCQHCSQVFSKHFCPICNLWTEFPLFHCDLCNICYKSTMEDRFHCDTCNLCFEGHREEHCCGGKKIAPDTECCVCLELLYYQTISPTTLPCGHWIHRPCLEKLLENNRYQCPLCKKTMISIDWSEFKSLVSSMPISPEEAKKVSILCNDCLIKTMDATFHPLGIQCSSCESFNTVNI